MVNDGQFGIVFFHGAQEFVGFTGTNKESWVYATASSHH
jgi:hypothetical protein